MCCICGGADCNWCIPLCRRLTANFQTPHISRPQTFRAKALPEIFLTYRYMQKCAINANSSPHLNVSTLSSAYSYDYKSANCCCYCTTVDCLRKPRLPKWYLFDALNQRLKTLRNILFVWQLHFLFITLHVFLLAYHMWFLLSGLPFCSHSSSRCGGTSKGCQGEIFYRLYAVR